MTRITFVAFILLTGFFYITGRPVDEKGPQANSFADLVGQKTAIGHASPGRAPKQLLNQHRSHFGENNSDGRAISGEQKNLILSSWNINAATPNLPSRNPRRFVSPSPQRARTSLAAIKAAALVKPKTNQIFGEVRNKVTSASVKPLAVSYQQRYAKKTKPVLGPRLTAVLLKRELRRVGCYGGNVTSRWNSEARAAIETFNVNTGAKLPTGRPTVRSLERVQQVTKIVCRKKTAVGRSVIANVGPDNSGSKALKKASPWRAKVQRQIKPSKNSNYRILPTVATSRYKSVGNIHLVKSYRTSKVTRAKRRRVAKRYRVMRSKRYRITRRKARRRPAVRSWRRSHRRKRFGFRLSGGVLSIN